MAIEMFNFVEMGGVGGIVLGDNVWQVTVPQHE